MNHELLKYCLLKIEQQLNWASSDLWLNQDFELLSERIFEETNIKLSITTLKRVWGKVNYASEPSISTLNALAKFIGYNNWSELKNSKTTLASKPQGHRPLKFQRKHVLTGSIIVLLAIALLGISRSALSGSRINMKEVSFGACPVARGLPNSVVFTYNFGAAQVDSAAIQQSWNKALTFSINPKGPEATGIYYYPGYFQAKLIANGEIIKEQGLKVGTQGWMATIQGDGPLPRYLYYGELLSNDALHLKSNLLEALHAESRSHARLLTYHYFYKIGSVSGDNFTIETRFKNTYKKSNGICRNVQILVHGTETVFLTPFSIPGCTSDLDLITAGQTFSGKENDHSMFGTTGNEWQHFKLVVKDQKAQYFLNDQLIITKEAKRDIGPIVGFKIRFEGAGELDFLRLSNNSELVFSEEFETGL